MDLCSYIVCLHELIFTNRKIQDLSVELKISANTVYNILLEAM